MHAKKQRRSSLSGGGWDKEDDEESETETPIERKPTRITAQLEQVKITEKGPIDLKKVQFTAERKCRVDFPVNCAEYWGIAFY